MRIFLLNAVNYSLGLETGNDSCYDKENKRGEGHMLPQEFLKRMECRLGEEYPEYLESLERPRAVALRFDPMKRIPDLPFALEPVPWEPMGYYYDPDSRPGLHPYHEAGVYYMQEASAMAPVVLLDPQPGERICDLCAAPGGKSTQIAGRLRGEGLLLCNEIEPKRARILSRNIERMGIANAMVTNEHPAVLAERFPDFFDRVLVDAPCSGEGMFRKEEAAVTDWSVQTVQMCADRQRQILHSAAVMVRPGGRLVYSTCTFAPEENEETVVAFLEQHPDFYPEEADAPWFAKGENGSFRLWPHKLKGEGHFAAVLRRQGDDATPEVRIKEDKLPKEWLDFAKDLAIRLPDGRPVLFGQSLYWVPEELPDIARLKTLRPGLELGIVKKGRFEPAHALALWLKDCNNTVSFSANSEEMRRFLHGDVVPSEKRGWCLVQVDGYGIGWGKGDGTVLKNHYPKGLRR